MQHFTDIFSYKQFDYILNIDVDEFLYVSPEIHLIKFLNENKEKYNSVLVIPRVDCENAPNYNKNIKNLEILKYNFFKNIHINYSKNVLFNFYKKYGFLIIRNLFDKEQIQNITNQAQNIYKTQMMKLNLISSLNINNQEFEDNIKILFKNNFDTFLNCGKQCQHIIDLWKLSLDDKIINIIKFLGIKNPNISTRPVLFSNSKYISKTDMNHTVPPHQDWASMQGSINSIVCWIPLVDINQNLGSIALVPASHKLGLLSNEKKDSFGLVDNFNDDDFKSCDVKQGDAIFFSSFLVHKSGDNITSNIRWSTHFRYNDLDEKTFVENGYPHAYIYKPKDELLVPNFDTKKAANNYFENT
jgi:ectoine hydroxylase-related dioxygenase (phytanoyl-CoA dioxygenase family)